MTISRAHRRHNLKAHQTFRRPPERSTARAGVLFCQNRGVGQHHRDTATLSVGTAATISNLHFSPSRAPLGSGHVQVTGSINFSDPDGDVVRVRITDADTEDFLDVQWWAYV